MKSTIIYIHGLDSSPEAQAAQAVRAHFKGQKFIMPSVDHRSDPDKIRAQMDALGRSLAKEDDPIVVGSSAGGLWADYLAIKFGYKTVLINPALKPTVLFPKFGIPENYIAKYAKLEAMVAGKPRRNVVVYSGDKDDVVPTSVVHTHYKSPIVLKGEGHRLQNTKPVFDMIQSMIGNFPEDER
jgi:predicted esterase YcpF (UPF0227 family)